MVKVTQSGEVTLGSSLLVSDDQSPFSTLLNIVSCDDGSHTPLSLIYQLLIDLESVFGSLFEESLVGNLANVDTRFGEFFGREGSGRVDEVTL